MLYLHIDTYRYVFVILCTYIHKYVCMQISVTVYFFYYLDIHMYACMYLCMYIHNIAFNFVQVEPFYTIHWRCVFYSAGVYCDVA